MTKIQFILLFILAPLLSFGQGFVLKPVNAADIKKGLEDPKTFNDDVYVYLLQNYKPLSKPYNVKHDTDFDDKPLCGFGQKFEAGIVYVADSCGEGSGMSTSLTLPKTETAALKKWIEKMYKASGTELKNVWDKSGLIYQPEDEGAGCYYEIKQSKNKTVVDMYCGC